MINEIQQLGAQNLRDLVNGTQSQSSVLKEIRDEPVYDYGDDDQNQLMQQIKIFEEEMQESTNPKEKSILSKRIKRLYKRLESQKGLSPTLRSHKSPRSKSQSHSHTVSKERNQEKGIKEIFNFYARQHMMIGKKATFEMIEHNISVLNMGEFIAF